MERCATQLYRKPFTLLGAALLAVLLHLPQGAYANPVVYEYHAFLGGARAGTLTVSIDATDSAYTVEGEARSEGLMEAFNRWRARFAAVGRFVRGVAEPVLYVLHEKDERKERFVTVEDGELQYVKNGKPRLPRPALPGDDVLTALFVEASCQGVQHVHTGRHGYRLSPRQITNTTCHFDVTDDDDDEFFVAIEYGERNGRRVPLLIRGEGLVSGRLVLAD